MINFRNIVIVLKKEFRETFRDKAFIYTNFIGPLVFFPILIILISEIASVKNDEIKQEVYTLGFIGENLPQEVKSEILSNKKYRLQKISKDLQILLSYPIPGEHDKHVLFQAQKSIFKKFRKDKVDLVIHPQGGRLYVYLDETSGKSQRALDLLSEIVKKKRLGLTAQILNQNGISESDLDILPIIRKNVRPQSQTSGYHFGIVLSFFIIFILITSIHNPTINSTIGEKDRSTLNFLLMSPLTSREILLGKYINIAFQGMLALIPYGFQILVAYYNFDFLIKISHLSALNTPGILFIGLLIFSTSALLASISFTLTCMAKTMAQAQTLMSFIIFLVFIPLGIIQVLELGVDLKYAFFPIINFALGIQDIYISGGNHLFYFASFLSNIFYSILLILYADYFFKAQNILSKSESVARSTANLRKVSKNDVSPTISMVLGIFIPFIIFNSGTFTFIRSHFLYMVLFNTIFANLVITIMILRFYKVGLQSSIGFHKFSPSLAIGAICLTLGIFPIISYLGGLALGATKLSDFISKNELVSELPLPIGILFFAIFPGICEEISYRGAILRGLKKRYPEFISILTASILYTICQLSLGRIVPVFLLSMVLGYLALRGRSIYLSMLAHILFNTLILVASHYGLPTGPLTWAVSLIFLSIGIKIFFFKKRPPRVDPLLEN